MSYKVFLFDALGPIEWSQAAWRVDGHAVPTEDCEQEFIRDVLLEHLPRGGLVVDAGCGTAKWPIYLRRRGFRVMGVDICHEAGRLARATDPGFDFVRGDVRATPLRAGAADAVISLGVVEHDEAGPLAALREARRILKAGGTLVLSVPFDNALRRLLLNHVLTWVTRKRRRANVRLGFVEYRFTRREVDDFLLQTGFEPLAAFPNDYHPPKNVGLWVDWQNLTFNPFAPTTPDELFQFRGWKRLVANALVRWTPWLVCAEVTVLARAR